MTQNMETFGARLASFDRVLQPEKRRGSSAKSAKSIAWPHRRPSPAELAHAGFFYNPYETNPDNTTCFLCRRALDGWEEEDNPITEHLKHSPDCGWALMMDIQQHSSNPAEIEDPTSDTIRQARLATFGELWPHDGKRGWVCQSEKMVDGGWYFCPTDESDDLASCAYCKLSLDGWEPKDDPFDEHYRRSSDCSFFVFAQSGGKKKGSRSKKARTFKVSRQSTQSTVSEAPVSDVDVIDPPAMSQSTTKPKTTKKASKSKTKTSKLKKAEPEPELSPAEMEIDELEEPQPKRAARGKKRPSGEVDPDQEDSDIANTQEVEHAEAPTKKKAKKSRESAQEKKQEDVVIADAHQEEGAAQEPQEQEEPKKARGTSKKKTSAKSRKASSASSTSKPTAKSEEPQEVDMYAALEAELDNPEPAQSNEKVEQKPAKKSKSKKKKKDASPEPSGEDVPQLEESHPDVPQETVTTEPLAPEEPTQPKTKQESTKRESNKRESAKQEKPRGRSSSKRVNEEPTEPTKPSEPAPEPASDVDDGTDIDVSRHESFVSVEIPNKLPAQDPPADSSDKDTKKQKKKSSLEKTKKPKKTSKTAPEPVQSIEEPIEESNVGDQVQSQEAPKPQGSPEIQEQEPDPEPPRRRSSRMPPKTTERYSDIPEEKKLAKSLAGSRNSVTRAALEEDTQKDDEPEAVSPIPSASKSTPSLSPQSSDAENRPPSMKPSASRPVAASPSRQPTLPVPLAPSTPSPSKRAPTTGGLNTSCPWKPVDIDEILFAGNSDKENVDITTALSSVKGDLSSPEKKMTVEQWIAWNAKNGEERLRRECERLVGQFEKEGARAMRVLEGIECTD
ncbi:uncharacterized protein KD926_004720 [Aspergillus affinis]|uniref:uncharacterized protein n=1 Tax=Aspergillus affinis TaxID=1070780 RepID=UPI0022FEB8B3|nr:uncharacterized protein KD926_004720 [Aspergillus affinis]KAI9042929.1 hypothetical protein KD926_004720 [Aspergillus affinis]